MIGDMQLTSAIAGALAGSITGIAGAWVLGSRAEARRNDRIVEALLLEILVNTTCIDRAVREGIRTLDSLKTDTWNRVAPDLSGALPREFVAHVYAIQAGLDEANTGYLMLGGGINDPTTAKRVNMLLLQWVYQAVELVCQIREYRSSKLWMLRWWRRLFRSMEDREHDVEVALNGAIADGWIYDGAKFDPHTGFEFGLAGRFNRSTHWWYLPGSAELLARSRGLSPKETFSEDKAD